MRTTIDLPEDVLTEAKERAAREGRTLSAVVADAVRSSFSRADSARARRFTMSTFGTGGTQPGVDLDDSAALLDVMELGD